MLKRILGILYFLIGLTYLIQEAFLILKAREPIDPQYIVKVENLSSNDTGVTSIFLNIIFLLIGIALIFKNKIISRIVLLSLPLLVLADILLNNVLGRNYNIFTTVPSHFHFFSPAIPFILLLPISIALIYKSGFKK